MTPNHGNPAMQDYPSYHNDLIAKKKRVHTHFSISDSYGQKRC